MRFMIAIMLLFVHPLTTTSYAPHNFSRLLGESYRFYEAQMSGDMPTWSRASQVLGGWRNRSHTNDGRGPNGIGMDLSGGWYDAGDHLKLHLTLGVTVSMLAYGALAWEDTYRASGEWDTAVRNIDWASSYLLKCHINSSDTPSENTFVAQVGDGKTDHDMYWGRPEQQPEGGAEGSVGWRPVYVLTAAKGQGGDIVAEAAASLAGASLLLRRPGANSDVERADLMLKRARQLFQFAKLLPNLWLLPSGYLTIYASQRFKDDMAWAAAWLCRADVDAAVATAAATNTTLSSAAAAAASSSCAEAVSLWSGAASSDEFWTDVVSWASVFPLASQMLRDVEAGGDTMAPRYDKQISYVLERWVGATNRTCTSASSEYQVCYTPGGLAWYTEWGSARCAANMAMAALLASRGGGLAATFEQRRGLRCWALGQLSYILGDNPKNQSYVVGYKPTASHSSPTRIVHESSSCSPDYSVTCNWNALSNPDPNPSVVRGALVGGPNRFDEYADVRSDYVKNEVALDYNSGFTGALAGLAAVSMMLQQAGCDWAGYCAATCGPLSDPAPRPCPALGSANATCDSNMTDPSPSPSPSQSGSPAPSPSLGPPPSPSATPAPSPSRNPSPSPDLSPNLNCDSKDWACKECYGSRIADTAACLACVQRMTGPGLNPSICLDCGKYGAASAAVQDVCFSECVPGSVVNGTGWACSMYCANVDYVGDDATLARQCSACLTQSHDAWSCSNCIQVTRCHPQSLLARAQCFGCVIRGVIDGKTCADCVQMGSWEAREGCMACHESQASRRRNRQLM